MHDNEEALLWSLFFIRPATVFGAHIIHLFGWLGM